MRILHISVDYRPNSGGIASHVYSLARAQRCLGHEVTIHGGSRSVDSGKRNVETDWDERIVAYRGGRFRRIGRFIFAGLAALRSKRFDVVHFHNFFPDGLLGNTAFLMLGAKIVFTNHSSQFIEAVKANRKATLFRLLTLGANGIICPSAELYEMTRQQPFSSGKQVEYIPNGVDINLFSVRPGPNPWPLYGISPESKVILATRRHEYKNGLHVLVESMPAVLQAHRDAVFVLAGSGSQTEQLRARVRDLGIENGVRFLGDIPNADLPDLYQHAYVSVLPSLLEAVSISGLEALSCGCPVVGTNVGGIPEIVRDGHSGLTVNCNNHSELAAALIRILDQPEYRTLLSGNARVVAEGYSWESVARRTVNFYRNME